MPVWRRPVGWFDPYPHPYPYLLRPPPGPHRYPVPLFMSVDDCAAAVRQESTADAPLQINAVLSLQGLVEELGELSVDGGPAGALRRVRAPGTLGLAAARGELRGVGRVHAQGSGGGGVSN